MDICGKDDANDCKHKPAEDQARWSYICQESDQKGNGCKSKASFAESGDAAARESLEFGSQEPSNIAFMQS